MARSAYIILAQSIFARGGGQPPRWTARSKFSNVAAGTVNYAFLFPSTICNSFRHHRSNNLIGKSLHLRIASTNSWNFFRKDDEQRQNLMSYRGYQQSAIPTTSRPSPSCLSLASESVTLENHSGKSRKVVDVMVESIRVLETANVDEPNESVFQMLADVLDLSWESGFRELRQAYQRFELNGANANAERVCDDNDDNQSVHDKPTSQQTTTGTELQAASLTERILTEDELDRWKNYMNGRLQHEPLQYILGKWDFLDYTLQIRAPLLCPRPETEELVLLARQVLYEKIRQQQQITMFRDTDKHKQRELCSKIRVLDVGCGTGCIGIALCADANDYISEKCSVPSLESSISVNVVALDVEPVAISVATENAQKVLGKTLAEQQYTALLMAAADFDPTLVHRPLIEGTSNNDSPYKFDLVVSNPPYIPPSEMSTLDETVRNYESHVALSGLDPDGMMVIRQIVQSLPKWCNNGGVCWMEVHPTHPALLQEWLSSTTSFRDEIEGQSLPPKEVEFVQTVQDFQGKDRFVQLRVTK